ncbi:hypothetical protein A2U01_0080217, partial [Trifolium medium]|nr:hypothetical protein [Trifolium medium]
LQRQNATETLRNLKVPRCSNKKRQASKMLAGRLAGRPCPVLENQVAVYTPNHSKSHTNML